MTVKTKVRYLFVKELEDRIKERKAEAGMRPDGQLRREIMSGTSDCKPRRTRSGCSTHSA
jgi:hypothetical protein